MIKKEIKNGGEITQWEQKVQLPKEVNTKTQVKIKVFRLKSR